MKTRFYGSFACVIVALDCFGKKGGELQLPYWLWAVVGVAWCFGAVGVLVGSDDA